jgi:hypothetical protein
MKTNENVEDTIRAKQRFSQKLLVCSVLVCAVFVSTVLAVHLLHARAPSQPRAVAFTLCQTAPRGTLRVSADFGTQFNAPESEFIVHTSMHDMPPGTLYTVTPTNGAFALTIWRDNDVIFRDLRETFPVYSERVEQREIHNSEGTLVGTDRWGSLKSGERWRYVTFLAGDAVGYSPAPVKDARLLDQVINSACVSPGPQNSHVQ